MSLAELKDLLLPFKSLEKPNAMTLEQFEEFVTSPLNHAMDLKANEVSHLAQLMFLINIYHQVNLIIFFQLIIRSIKI
jgi:hypothetical protein